MRLLKAIIKFIARTLNDIVLNHDIKKAQPKAYAETGKRLKSARRNGYRINGSKCYSKTYDKYVNAAKARHLNRDKFLSDL